MLFIISLISFIFIIIIILVIIAISYYVIEAQQCQVKSVEIENFNNNKKSCYQLVDCAPPKKTKRDRLYEFNYQESHCPSHSLHPGEKCLHCPWKRPGLDVNDNPKCCRNKCYKKKEKGIPYYCEQYGICVKKYQKPGERKFCGFYTLYNTPAKIYNSFKQCKNDLNIYQNLNKDECLNTNGAGWCTDYRGTGLCVPGTPEGPTDPVRYDTCYVNQISNKNSWTPGFYDPHIILRNSHI